MIIPNGDGRRIEAEMSRAQASYVVFCGLHITVSVVFFTGVFGVTAGKLSSCARRGDVSLKVRIVCGNMCVVWEVFVIANW